MSGLKRGLLRWSCFDVGEQNSTVAQPLHRTVKVLGNNIYLQTEMDKASLKRSVRVFCIEHWGRLQAAE